MTEKLEQMMNECEKTMRFIAGEEYKNGSYSRLAGWTAITTFASLHEDLKQLYKASVKADALREVQVVIAME